jgi:TonB-dependent SusC/RagA subfamily outer membrane receptor
MRLRSLSSSQSIAHVSRRRLSPILFLAGLAVPAVMRAQSGVVAGTVTDARTNEPIEAATVNIEGTSYGATTGPLGTYRITNVPVGPFRLTARRIGYAKLTHQGTAGAAAVTVNFALERTATTLEEMVVTGVALGQTKRELGNAVGQVKVSDVVQVAPPPNVQQLLNNVPGVRVQPAGGDVGSGGNTRVRGASSMTIASEPLIYVDGVRVNNAFADAGGVTAVGIDGRYPPSRINDINPDEIERIEIIKGPSAATLYGTEAANGVINIITKRGGGGRAATITYQAREGANWLPDPEHLFQHSYSRSSTGQIVDANVLAYEREVVFPVSYYGSCPKPFTQSVTMCK